MPRFLSPLLLVCGTLSLPLFAAEPADPPAQAELSPQHRWLQRFVGRWTTEMDAPAQGDQPAMHCEGTMHSRTIGNLWVVNEIKASPQGMQMHGIQTIGYDPAKKKFVGTWVDSMMNHLWHYEGTLDTATQTLTLQADGPDFANPGKTAKYRDIYQFVTPDQIKATSALQTPDGQWISFMTGVMQRQKE